jgi:hypothetical protein
MIQLPSELKGLSDALNTLVAATLQQQASALTKTDPPLFG